MTQINSTDLQQLMRILEAVPDINDVLIRNKTLCALTNSRDLVYIDFANTQNFEDELNQELDIPSTMTLVDFGIKSKTLKALSENYAVPVSYKEENNKITFVFGSGSTGQIFESNIPIVNNHHKLQDFEEIFNNPEIRELFTLNISTATMNKLKTMLDLYKASPSIIREEMEDGSTNLVLRIQSSSKTDEYKTSISDTDKFNEKGINLTQPLKLQRFLFDYAFSGESIEMKFYSLDDKIIIRVSGILEGRHIQYVYRTQLEKSLDEIVDITAATIDFAIGM